MCEYRSRDMGRAIGLVTSTVQLSWLIFTDFLLAWFGIATGGKEGMSGATCPGSIFDLGTGGPPVERLTS